MPCFSYILLPVLLVCLRLKGVASTILKSDSFVSNIEKLSWCLLVIQIYLASGGFDGRNPFGSIEARRIESGCQFGVFITVDVVSVHIPFSLGGHTVKCPERRNIPNLLS